MSDTRACATVVPRHPSVLHALDQYVRDGHRRAVTVVGRTPETAELAELAAAARRYAAILADRGVAAGDRVLMGMSTSLASVVGFFAVQLLGAIPAPVAVLPGGGRNSTRRTLENLSRYLRPKAIAAPHSVAAELAQNPVAVPALVLDADDLYRRAGESSSAAEPFLLPEPGGTAFIQCTSGSTGAPKGVVVSHANVAANCEQIAEFAGWTTDDAWTGWLPLYHDMGLIGGLLTPLFSGSSAVMVPTTRFLRSPVEWFRAVDEYGGTISATPNFGLAYASRRVTADDLKSLDLSSLRMIFCGAEPISRHTVHTFATKFEQYGLPENAVVPCYGLAESTLIVTADGPGSPIGHDVVSRQAMATEGIARDTTDSGSDALDVVEVGSPVRGTEVRVVDESGGTVPESFLGRVQFRGPGRTSGYFELPEVSATCLEPGGWWNTGDIGYLRDGRLRITGRERDLIVIRGANYFPHDFERAAESSEGVVTGAVVAVGHRDDVDGTEQLCLIIESEVGPEEHADIERAVRAAVSTHTGVAVSRIRFVPRQAIPKTTSGKVQRSLAYQRFIVDG